jgi:DNA primase
MKATPKQRATLDSMQIQYDDEITVESASELIAAYIEKRKQMVEDFKRNNPIDAIIERYGNQQVGRDHKIFAPWRAEATPSVHIYEDGSWHDFGAGVGGDVLDYLGHFFFGSNYSRDTHFPDVVDRIGSLDIKPLPAQISRPKPVKPKLTIDLEQCLTWHDTMPTHRRAYWHGRGLTDTTINQFFLGWDGKRYTIPLLYRLIPFGVKRRQSDVDDGIDAKYIMTTGSRAGIYNADALAAAQQCIICEGEIDAMILTQLGYNAVTSTAGAGSWKEDWARFFTHVKDIHLLFDNDKAGREGAAKVHATLRRARIVTLPEGVKDVGELWQAGYAASWLKENVG